MPAQHDELDPHLGTVLAQLRQGKVIPFLGAGANTCNRVEGAAWNPDQRDMLPDGRELARYLGEVYGYRHVDTDNLVRVAEYVSLTAGHGPLYDTLRELFDAKYPPTSLHELLAGVSGRLRAGGWVPLQLVVTTNYDDLIEQAFRAAGEEIDVITYMAVGPERGQFIHEAPDGTIELIEAGRANEYAGLPLGERDRLQRTAVLKIHGAVDRSGSDRDSFVITEDDYIEYLTRSDISLLLPPALQVILRRSNFLFLGYGLRDWNMRALLHRIWSAQRARYNAWAVQHNPDLVDRKAWEERGVDILSVPLNEYVSALAGRLDELQPRTAPDA